MNGKRVAALILVGLVGLVLSGCASTSKPDMGWYNGSVYRAPLERIEPGTVVRFRLKAISEEQPKPVERTVDDGEAAVTYRITVGGGRSEELERTVKQAYGDVGFVTTFGEGVRYDQIDTMDFQYRLSGGEVFGDRAKMAIAVPLVIPCVLLGGCPMR